MELTAIEEGGVPAVVARPAVARFSSRFGEMVAEESKGPHFGPFETRGAAGRWLAEG
jgi:hypothetical protein